LLPVQDCYYLIPKSIANSLGFFQDLV